MRGASDHLFQAPLLSAGPHHLKARARRWDQRGIFLRLRAKLLSLDWSVSNDLLWATLRFTKKSVGMPVFLMVAIKGVIWEMRHVCTPVGEEQEDCYLLLMKWP